MPKIHVTGNGPLRGTVRIAGAKNAALPVIAAGLLSDDDDLDLVIGIDGAANLLHRSDDDGVLGEGAPIGVLLLDVAADLVAIEGRGVRLTVRVAPPPNSLPATGPARRPPARVPRSGFRVPADRSQVPGRA